MNQIDAKLPEIDERACHYAMLEYEVNQVLKEFELKTEVHDEEEKTVDYIYNKLNIIHNQIKLQKAQNKLLELKIKNTEETVAECRREMVTIKELLVYRNYEFNSRNQDPPMIDLTSNDTASNDTASNGRDCIFDVYNPQHIPFDESAFDADVLSDDDIPAIGTSDEDYVTYLRMNEYRDRNDIDIDDSQTERKSSSLK